MEVIYLYCAFSYLFMVGIVISGWQRYDHAGLIVGFILSPITMPLTAGVYLDEAIK